MAAMSGNSSGKLQLEHPVADANVRLDVLRRVGLAFELLAQRRHEDAQRSDVVFPAPAPDVPQCIPVP